MVNVHTCTHACTHTRAHTVINRYWYVFSLEGEISEAVHTLNRGVKSRDVEVFRDVKDLVTEEVSVN